jgi:hypothetical protein
MALLITNSGPFKFGDNALYVVPYSISTGGNIMPVRVGDLAVSGSLTTAGDTVITTGSPNFWVTAFFFSIPQDCLIGTAGEVSITMREDSLAPFMHFAFYLPKLANAVVANEYVHNPPGFVFTSTPSSANLILNLSTTLTAGAIAYTINFGHGPNS